MDSQSNQVSAASQIPVPKPGNANSASVSMICPQCHQPVQPEYYYCPNCGKKLSEPGLSTSTMSQILLYVFSAVLPFIGYLAISKWQGMQYIRSGEPRAQQIGWIAMAILVISSIFAIWQVTVWIQGFVQAQTSTAGLSQLGL